MGRAAFIVTVRRVEATEAGTVVVAMTGLGHDNGNVLQGAGFAPVVC